MFKRSENILSLLVAPALLFVFSATPIYAGMNADQTQCKVTVTNNSSVYAVVWVDRINYGVVYPLRWNTFSLNKVNYQGQPYHFEIRVDVNKNGNPVTVKEEYVDLSNRNEYSITYP